MMKPSTISSLLSPPSQAPGLRSKDLFEAAGAADSGFSDTLRELRASHRNGRAGGFSHTESTQSTQADAAAPTSPSDTRDTAQTSPDADQSSQSTGEQASKSTSASGDGDKSTSENGKGQAESPPGQANNKSQSNGEASEASSRAQSESNDGRGPVGRSPRKSQQHQALRNPESADNTSEIRANHAPRQQLSNAAATSSKAAQQADPSGNNSAKAPVPLSSANNTSRTEAARTQSHGNATTTSVHTRADHLSNTSTSQQQQGDSDQRHGNQSASSNRSVEHAASTQQSKATATQQFEKLMDRLGLEKAPGHNENKSSATNSTNAANQFNHSSPAVGRAAQVDSTVRVETLVQNELQALSGSNATVRGGGATSAGQTTTLFDAQQAATQTGSNEPNTTARVVRGLSAMVNQRGGSMTMRLDPPDLGSMRVQMQVDRGVVTAQFHTTTAEAHSILSRNLAMLRQSLEQQGLTVERIAVHHSTSTQSHAMRDNGADQQQSDRHDPSDAGDGRSRGRHDHDNKSRNGENDAFSRFVHAHEQSDLNEAFADMTNANPEGALQS